ncbi:IucA/IucC family siderophore biosynthesis protein [Actibacterium sp. 188UL27-1]|uniref:IucA/IucC family protein n=1 Tax=Actibacterium sp. 188UL27-1 TaxID=2786961 RepID=UPI00195DA9FC|nr:IucA/IucC family protein [Actibacterium sp. 188UL27-1]MBM7069738.1 hypothetical protein [Actibacterium sp. 188UL27-1]
MELPDTQIELPALDAFINAALREDRLAKAQFCDGLLQFRDHHGVRVRIGLKARSGLRILCNGTILHGEGSAAHQISIRDLLTDLSAAGGSLFQARVLDSLDAICAAPQRQGRADQWTFAQAEQALKAGHAFHPNPRSRDEMTLAEAERYAPEHAGIFGLQWVAARPDHVQINPDAERLFRTLAQADLGTTPDDLIPLPWHPWQAKQLFQTDDMQTLYSAGVLKDLGEGSGSWTATSSMRCLHATHAPFMVKTSLSLRLTNSVRHLSLREVLRGIHVSDLLRSDLGKQIKRDFPTLHILGEPGYAALRDMSGNILDPTITVLRDNPFRDATSNGPVLLAALCEPSPHGPSPLGGLLIRLGPDAPKKWFTQFLNVVVWPILELRARYGLLFGAHQQNLMVGLSEGWPVAGWVRDCQGTGHLDSFTDRLTQACPGIGEGTENIVDAELGDGLVTYYVVVNSVLNTLATLVLDDLTEEQDLHDIWRNFLIRARIQTPGDDTLYTRLLDRSTLTCKGNFTTSISGMNEADGDARGQIATFFELSNPIAETLDA